MDMEKLECLAFLILKYIFFQKALLAALNLTHPQTIPRALTRD